jgi:S-adenosylmethionine:tRNA ribosyltransferase-isomerase
MQRADFYYELPETLIAMQPSRQRSDSRLLCVDPGRGEIRDRHFRDFPEILGPGDLLVFNNTRVMPARLLGSKESGGRIEVLVERITGEHEVLAHVRASKAPRPGVRLLLEGGVTAVVAGRVADLFRLVLYGELDAPGLLCEFGHVPLPPYIKRKDEPLDKTRYQTIFASRPGAVAAPTAGLHFDADTLQRLRLRGIDTLHVGAGTFQPVRVDNLDEHVMHYEYFEVDEVTCGKIAAARRRGGRVVAVGTTVVRSLETATRETLPEPCRGETNLFITPGYRFRCVDALLTNFHLPESTLLMLVCAFAGRERVLSAYRHAIEKGYRFYSYGDAMFLGSAAA